MCSVVTSVSTKSMVNGSSQYSVIHPYHLSEQILRGKYQLFHLTANFVVDGGLQCRMKGMAGLLSDDWLEI